MKKASLLFGILYLLCFTAKAQLSFSFSNSQIDSFTTGGLNSNDNVSYQQMNSWVKNTGTMPATLYWQLITNESNVPCNWLLQGICDYTSCKQFNIQQRQDMGTIPIGDSGIIDVRTYILTSHPDGIGDYYVKVYDSAQTQVDTIFFRLHKGIGGQDCLPTAISNISGDLVEIQLYPNPVHNVLTLQLSRVTKEYKVQISDLMGRTQITRGIEGSRTTIDVSTLPTGTYLLKVLNAHGNSIKIKKFTKQ